MGLHKKPFQVSQLETIPGSGFGGFAFANGFIDAECEAGLLSGPEQVPL